MVEVEHLRAAEVDDVEPLRVPVAEIDKQVGVLAVARGQMIRRDGGRPGGIPGVKFHGFLLVEIAQAPGDGNGGGLGRVERQVQRAI